MIIYLAISCITISLCVLTYLWVIHKLGIKKKVTLNVNSPVFRTDENGIIDTRRNYLDELLQERQLSHNVFPDGVRPKTDKLSPKKDIKSHKLIERKYTMRRPGVHTIEMDYNIIVTASDGATRNLINENYGTIGATRNLINENERTITMDYWRSQRHNNNGL